MAPIIAAYLLLLLYFVSDARLRKSEKARQVIDNEADRRSTIRLVQVFGVSILLLLLAPLLNAFHLGRAGTGLLLAWLGVALMALGILLRAWSTRVLGRFYTRTLLIDSGHRLVREGPYRLVRHPGYTGSLLVWIGAGLAAANWIVFIPVSLLCLAAYIYRMRSEEAMLLATFGQEYEEYMRCTKRLVPFIY